ncbi:BTAD domain-containing putative transcriptional regulator [Kineococcus sp. SYSU DK003]|uniref:BTAD domain-containing putative transcriptional regulator n=1 Tax=Kineococcus sp. SYSU DK003 TaxID=3383124 RepID=UPI003D7EBE00
MPAEEDRGVRVRVLGPVEVRTCTAAVPLGPSLRTVLAALAVDAGRVVDADVLADRVWGEAGIRPATSTMHSSVSRLRKALERSGARQAVRTRAPGYQLVLAAHGLDAVVFERSLTDARTLAGQDPHAARTTLTEALALWRGPAYADVPAEFARTEARRLEGRRLEALELLARVDLDLGRHREAVGGLGELVAAHPLHEDLRAALALALYRSSRQAEALHVLDEGRRLLGEELGIDPGPQLRRLRDLVLRQDPSLDGPAPAAAQEVHPPAPARAAVPPTATTSLVGRADDVARLVGLVRSSRLVTLTGTGGVGKTRLAAAVAEAARADFPGGGWFVPLAALTQASAVLPAVARAVGLPTATDEDVLDDVVARLGTARCLLVLDNCEHLLEAAADVAALVGRCPGLCVLVTSRAPLRVGGEVEHRVEPLAAAPARELFVQRAVAVAPGFRLDARTAGAVEEICRSLAGIPLALELAAARVRVLDVHDLLRRLDQALAGGARDLPERQRTMRATLDWSYGLLDEASQGLFRRLGVFTGGWTLEQLEVVEGPDVLDRLEVLVEHSLVTVDFAGTASGLPPRYAMLEPTLQHARRLLPEGEREQAARAHALAYAALAERATVGYRHAEQVLWLQRMDTEHPNVLAALDWAVAAGEQDLGGRLVWGSWLFWWLRGHLRTGRRCADAVVRTATAGPSPVVSTATVRALTACAAMAFAQGDGPAARAAWQQGLTGARALTDCPPAERDAAIAHCEAGLGICALVDGDLETAAAAHRLAIALAEPLPADSWGPWIVRLNRIWSATVAWRAGRVEAARAEVTTGLELARAVGDRLATYMALYNLALIEADVAPQRAAVTLLEGVLLSEQMGDLANLSYFLEALVVLLVRRTAPADQHAAPLLAALSAAAEAARETVGFEVYRYYPRDAAAAVAAAGALRGMLDEHQLQQAGERGRSATLAEVVALARTAVAESGAATVTVPTTAALTTARPVATSPRS